MADSTREYYDTYWSAQGFRPPPNGNPFLSEQIANLIHRTSRVADLGCGDARTIGPRAASVGATYRGVDVSPAAVDAARAAGFEVDLVDDISSSGLQGSWYDVVFVIEVFEHLLSPLAAAREARRILKPGGILVATAPNAAVWTRRLELLFRGRPNAMGDDKSRSEPWRDPHIRSFTVQSLGAMVRRAGFAEVTVGGTEAMLSTRTLADALTRARPSLFARRCTVLAKA